MSSSPNPSPASTTAAATTNNATSVTPSSSSASSATPALFQWDSLSPLLPATISPSTLSSISCCAATKHFVAAGTNKGTLYLFLAKRSKPLGNIESLQNLLFLSSTEFDKKNLVFSIEHLVWSPNGQYVGVACSTGILYVIEVTYTETPTTDEIKFKEAKIVTKNSEHASQRIESVCFSSDSRRIFSGDNQGQVCELTIPKKGSLFGSILSVNKVLKEQQSPITQLQCSGDHLLVSSTKRSLIVHLKERAFRGIGTKPRDGVFGACFQLVSKKQLPPAPPTTATPGTTPPSMAPSAAGVIVLLEYIFAARPGKRIWCAEKATSKVLSTLKFPGPKNLQFGPLLPMHVPLLTQQLQPVPYVISYDESSIAILDIVKVKVVDVKTDLGKILSVNIFENQCYIVHQLQSESNVQTFISRLTMVLPSELFQTKPIKPIESIPQQISQEVAPATTEQVEVVSPEEKNTEVSAEAPQPVSVSNNTEDLSTSEDRTEDIASTIESDTASQVTEPEKPTAPQVSISEPPKEAPVQTEPKATTQPIPIVQPSVQSVQSSPEVTTPLSKSPTIVPNEKLAPPNQELAKLSVSPPTKLATEKAKPENAATSDEWGSEPAVVVTTKEPKKKPKPKKKRNERVIEFEDMPVKKTSETAEKPEKPEKAVKTRRNSKQNVLAAVTENVSKIIPVGAITEMFVKKEAKPQTEVSEQAPAPVETKPATEAQHEIPSVETPPQKIDIKSIIEQQAPPEEPEQVVEETKPAPAEISKPAQTVEEPVKLEPVEVSKPEQPQSVPEEVSKSIAPQLVTPISAQETVVPVQPAQHLPAQTNAVVSAPVSISSPETKPQEEESGEKVDESTRQVTKLLLSNTDVIHGLLKEFLVTMDTLWCPDFLPSITDFISKLQQYIGAKQKEVTTPSNVSPLSAVLQDEELKSIRKELNEIVSFWVEYQISQGIKQPQIVELIYQFYPVLNLVKLFRTCNDSKLYDCLNAIAEVAHFLLTKEHTQLLQYIDSLFVQQERSVHEGFSVVSAPSKGIFELADAIRKISMAASAPTDNVATAVQQPWFFLNLLPRLLKINSQVAIQLCVEFYPTIQVTNVRNVILLSEQPSKEEKSRYLEYLIRLYESKLDCCFDTAFLIDFVEYLVQYLAEEEVQLEAKSSKSKSSMALFGEDIQENRRMAIEAKSNLLGQILRHIISSAVGIQASNESPTEALSSSLMNNQLLQQVKKILVKHNYVSGLLELYERTKNRQEIIRLLVGQDASESLTSYMENMQSQCDNVNEIYEIWSFLLVLVNEMEHQGHAKTISTNYVVCLMCLCLGSVHCLQILNNISGGSTTSMSPITTSSSSSSKLLEHNTTSTLIESQLHLDSQVYRKICELAQSEISQSKLKHDLLESVDSYMWSEKESSISMQVRTLFDRIALEQQGSAKLSGATASPNLSVSNLASISKRSSSFSMTVPVKAPSLLSQLRDRFKIVKQVAQVATVTTPEQQAPQYDLNFEFTSLPRNLEDANLHWGMETPKNMARSKCIICRLPLSNPSANGTQKQNEAIVFKCGHCFHRVCCSSEACPRCFQKNFKSIIRDTI